jgi:6-phosphofructo-2-kinase/fructose-2,6-biphosphatase 2
MIIAHQAVLRAIYAYFMNLDREQLPYVHIPLHTLIKLTPKAYGCETAFIKAPIEAVDTHRPRPNHNERGSYGDHAILINNIQS